MASKVNNLRAMFEQKQEDSHSSPPSRGRSPVGSDINSIRSTSSRPVSKIRSSFVAVEKSGVQGVMFGLRRKSDVQEAVEEQDSPKSGLTRTASHAGTERILEEVESEKDSNQGTRIQSPEESKITPIKANGISKKSDILPNVGSAVNGTSKTKEDIQSGTPKVNSNINGVKSTKQALANSKGDAKDDSKIEENVQDLKAKTLGDSKLEDSLQKSKAKINDNSTTEEVTQDAEAKDDGGSKTEEVAQETESKVNGTSKDIKGTAKNLKKGIEKLPAAIKTAIKPESSKSTTPTNKTPTTSKELPSRVKPEVKKPASLDTKATTSTTRPATSRPKAGEVKAPIKRDAKPISRVSTPRTSLAPSTKPIKTRPKSPTRPGRLPAAATAATASSAAKTAPEEPSTAHSTTTKPRTSTDGDFLARMMRPTAASASKIHDKSPKTTPQKAAVAKPKRMSEASAKPAFAKKTETKVVEDKPEDAMEIEKKPEDIKEVQDKPGSIKERSDEWTDETSLLKPGPEDTTVQSASAAEKLSPGSDKKVENPTIPESTTQGAEKVEIEEQSSSYEGIADTKEASSSHVPATKNVSTPSPITENSIPAHPEQSSSKIDSPQETPELEFLTRAQK